MLTVKLDGPLATGHEIWDKGGFLSESHISFFSTTRRLTYT